MPTDAITMASGVSPVRYTESCALPDWCVAAVAVERIDMDALLDAGEAPLPPAM